MTRSPLSRLVLAGLLTGLSDGLFACVLFAGFYGITITRLWQGVASVPMGPAALEGGTRTALIGVAMHFGVAFAWSAVFLLLFQSSAWLRRQTRSRGGVLKVAAVYGPLVWVMMSIVVIPLLTGRPPTIAYRWWIQLIGHFPFVGLPLVASIARGATDDVRRS